MEDELRDNELGVDEVKPMLKSWWFWILLSVLAILVVVLIYVSNRECDCDDAALNESVDAEVLVVCDSFWN